MKTTFLRTLVAFGSLMMLTSFATAEPSGFGGLLDRRPNSPSDLATEFDVALSSYSDGDVMEDMPDADSSDDEGTSSAGCDSSDEGCKCGDSCCCDSCESCRPCGVCTCDSGSCGSGCADCACDSCGECYSDGCGCGCDTFGRDGCCGDCGNGETYAGMYYAEIQNMFMRTHVSSQTVGKLREKYEWSPRIVMGYESPNGLGGRMRWWNYSRTNSTLDTSESLHLELDVFDAEGTARFSSKRADLVVAGGFRYANIEIAEDSDEIAADLPGITFAADGRMAICCKGRSQWSGVCGARWSLLFGDWEGDDISVLDPVFDDNVTTHEIYGGFEYLRHNCNYDVYARLVFEVQNWHSDALGENSATDSIGFVGPAIHCGASF